MATMIVERSELQTQIAVSTEKLQTLQRESTGWQEKLAEETRKLSRVQADYAQSCRDLAAGKNADPLVVQDRMRFIENKIGGLKQLVANAETAVQAQRRELQIPQQALSVIEQADTERREAEDVNAKFEAAKKILARRDAAQGELNNAVAELRNGVYVSARNRSDALNHATQIERLSVGIIN